MNKIIRFCVVGCASVLLTSFNPYTSYAESTAVETPTDFESAELFYNTYGETAINSTKDGAIIVVRDDGITDKYSYVFKDDFTSEQDLGYTIDFTASYNFYDVYEVSFNEKRDYSINLLFWNHEKDQQEFRGTELNLVYEYDETEGMKVSETPTTNKQTEIFQEKYGNSKVFGNKVVVIAENVYKIETESDSEIHSITTEYQVCANTDTANMQPDGNDIIIPTGNPIVSVYELDMSNKDEESLQILIGRTNDIRSVHRYKILRDENGTLFSSDSIQLKGDVDNNGTVGDLYDVIEIAKYLIGTTVLSETTLFLADINCDGHINLYDAIEIAKTLLS